MKKVLIVEDNPSDAKILAFILQKQNYQIQLAGDAHQALEILNNYPVDIVLLDWQLPQITGLEVLKTLRKDNKFKQLPIILISGKNELKDVQTAIKSGANDYIIKPIDPLILESKMSRFIEKETDWKLIPLPNEEAERASLNIKIRIEKLSEIGLEMQTDFPLQPGTTLEVCLNLLGDLEIPPLQVRVYNCSKKDLNYVSTCSLVGVKEVDLQKIRLYVRMLQLEKNQISA